MVNSIIHVIITFCILLVVNGDVPSTIGDGQCMWYGVCGKNPEPGKGIHDLNCYYDGPSKILDKKKKRAYNRFKKLCPELYDDILEEYGEIRTCCSPDQITRLSQQLLLIHPLLQRCPACLSNFKKNYCYFTCHPRHTAFLNPTEFHYHEKSKKNAVLSVEQFMSYTYVNNTFESCQNVYSEVGFLALDLMCGSWGTKYCNPTRWYNYLADNDMTPFKITYNYGENNSTATRIIDNSTYPVTPFVIGTVPCNTTDPEMHCVCTDCQGSCQAPPQPEPPKEHLEVGVVRMYVFLILLTYFVFVTVFLLYAFLVGLPGYFKDELRFCTFNHRMSAKFEETLQASFRKSTEVIANHPIVTLIIGAIVIIIFSTGITKLKLTTDPVQLWASPESRTRNEKDNFDKNFGPFYRTNQLIITSVGIEPFDVQQCVDVNCIDFKFGPVLNSTFLMEVMNLQLQIMNLTAEFEDRTITLNDICIKPLSPLKDECMIQSVLNYWQNDPDAMMSQMIDQDGNESLDYTRHLITCFNNPTYLALEETCLGTYGGPVFPYVALGGFLEPGQTLEDHPSYEKSTALVLTILGQNYIDKGKLGPALAWEKVFMDFMKSYSNPMMDIAFYSERGIEDEIVRESKGDVATILISYLVMFTYVTISLGQPTSDCKRLFIETKMTLGICSVLLVFLSVIASIGLCSYLGVEGTLFVIEVIPFLVLAIGVDNIYLLIQTWQREPKKPEESVEAHVARCVGKVAPSMLIATLSEAVCFFLGGLSKMPAVHAFAIFAGVAVSIGFILQITCLVALMVLDAQRLKENRYDMLCCASGPKKVSKDIGNEIVCISFFEKIYSPILFKDYVRAFVVIVFAGFFALSCIFIPKMDVGLEQDLGMPSDSFMIKYFDYLAKYLSVGSPVYFVIEEGFNFTDIEEQNLICQSKGCYNDSMMSQISWAARGPDVTSVASRPFNWLDSYFLWISDGTGFFSQSADKACCRLDRNGNFINSSEPVDDNARKTCLSSKDFVDGLDRPEPDKFMRHLPDFLIDNPHGTLCSVAGHASFGTAVVVKECRPEYGFTPGPENTCVGANHFMAYHTILKTSRDFTEALEKVYKLTDQLNLYLKNNSNSPNAKVYPYSIFYVYYEQYLTMWSTTAESLGISLLTVFLMMSALSGLDLWSAAINTVVITMIVVDIMGVMVFWNIQLNAISLVNLVMAMGISVEFCNHITHAFALSTGTRIERASRTLINVGSSVLSGITMTKFGGIIVLAFATSNIIIIFYFRMYLLIVLFGSAHGLIFLPVLLSLIGPPSNNFVESDDKHQSEPVPLKYVNEAFKD